MNDIPEAIQDYILTAPAKAHEPDSVIFREGDQGVNAFIVAEGEVIICARNKTGELVHLTTLTKGHLFGELALFHDDLRTATAITETGCKVVIQRAQLNKKLMETDPLVRLWVEYLAGRIIDLSVRVGSD